MENERKDSAPMQDDEIVELYWKRDEQAIKETDVKYGKYLFTIAHNILHDRMDSEECINDTYLGTWNRIPPSRPKLLQVFLAKVTRNLALDLYRHNTAERRVPSELISSYDELDDCISVGMSVEEEYAVRELGRLLNTFIRGLNSRAEFIFFCRYYYADPLEDIADRLALSRSTVVRELARVRKQLKSYLEKEGFRYE